MAGQKKKKTEKEKEKENSDEECESEKVMQEREEEQKKKKQRCANSTLLFCTFLVLFLFENSVNEKKKKQLVGSKWRMHLPISKDKTKHRITSIQVRLCCSFFGPSTSITLPVIVDVYIFFFFDCN